MTLEKKLYSLANSKLIDATYLFSVVRAYLTDLVFQVRYSHITPQVKKNLKNIKNKNNAIMSKRFLI